MHNIELRLDAINAARAVTLTHTELHDSDLLVKTALTEALGGPCIRPWAVLRRNGPTAVITGYSAQDADALRERLAFASPAIQAAISDIFSAPMPEFSVGQSLRFTLRLTPTINVTRRGERDAYLVARDAGRTETREAVYVEYLSQRLRGAEVRVVVLDRFQLAKVSRPHRGSDAPETGVVHASCPMRQCRECL